jgi:peptidoglycan/xylan/chitin deacetylase (PgdA/CDA1 family)
MKTTILFVTAVVIIGVSFLWLSQSAQAALTKGYVSFTFDDGDKTLYQNVRPMFKSLGVIGTGYITTDFVGDSDHVSWSQIKTLQTTDGWEIGNHTKSHKDLSLISDQEILAELNGAQTAFTNNGVKNVKAFAPPFGEYNDHIVSLMKSTGYLTSSRQAWTEGESFNTLSNFKPWAINVVSLDKGVKVSQIKTLLDEAARDKKWLVLVIHEIVTTPKNTYQYKTTDLNLIASYAATLKKSSQLDAVTISQGLSLMNSDPAPVPTPTPTPDPEPIPTPTPTPTGENLIKNPGFDSGWTNWHQSGSGVSLIDITQATANQYSPYPGKRLKIAGGSGEYTVYTDNIKLPDTGVNFFFREWANVTLTKGRFGLWIDEFDSSGKYISGKEIGGFASNLSGTTLSEFKYQRSSTKVSSIAINIYSESGTAGTALFDSCYFGL